MKSILLILISLLLSACESSIIGEGDYTLQNNTKKEITVGGTEVPPGYCLKSKENLLETTEAELSISFSIGAVEHKLTATCEDCSHYILTDEPHISGKPLRLRPSSKVCSPPYRGILDSLLFS